MTTQQIRGNLQIMDGTLQGSMIIEQAGGSPSINNADKIIFSGAEVTDLGSGDVQVRVTGGFTTENIQDIVGDMFTAPSMGTGIDKTYDDTSGTITLTAAINESHISLNSVSTNDVNTSTHGFIPKLTPPGVAGLADVPMNIASDTTASWQPLFDTTVPERGKPLAATGSQMTAARRDHIHNDTPADGWLLVTDTWNRTGNFTFTISGDVRTQYRKGTKVRYRDGGTDEYGVIGAVSYSAPNTTITLITNSDYAMASATITDTYLSYIQNPEGFPEYFNWNCSWTNVPLTSYVAKWYVTAPCCLHYEVEFTASGSATGSIGFTLPIANVRSTNNPVIGIGYCLDSGVASYPMQISGSVNSTSANLNVQKYNPTSATNPSYVQQAFVNATIPFTWGSGDQGQCFGDYEF